MSTPFHVIIPARYASSRFPGKLLKDLGGMTVIERVYRQALQANPLSVWIATDDERIVAHAKGFGADVLFSDTPHQSGSDRVAEAASRIGLASEDILVNVQGDEPFIAQQLIEQAANALYRSHAFAATLCWPITHIETFENPNVVKVVRDMNHHALYFSRSPIPANRDKTPATDGILGYKHVGLYAYRVKNVQQFVQWPSCALEQCEALEQLRILWHGQTLVVEEAVVAPQQDINTPEDLLAALNKLRRAT